VLDPAETFLLGRGDDVAIANQAGSGVTMERIDAENRVIRRLLLTRPASLSGARKYCARQSTVNEARANKLTCANWTVSESHTLGAKFDGNHFWKSIVTMT
jgi:hypothetical protein